MVIDFFIEFTPLVVPGPCCSILQGLHLISRSIYHFWRGTLSPLAQLYVSRAIDTLVYTRLPPEPSAELVPNLRTDAPLLPLSAGCLAPPSPAAAALPPQRYPVPVLSGRANVLAF